MNPLIMRSLLPLAVLFIAGCATSSPIERYSESKSLYTPSTPIMSNNIPQKDIYRVSVQGATGFVPMSALREDLEDRAFKFADMQGKGVLLLGEKISPSKYYFMTSPSMELVFATIKK